MVDREKKDGIFSLNNNDSNDNEYLMLLLIRSVLLRSIFCGQFLGQTRRTLAC